MACRDGIPHSPGQIFRCRTTQKGNDITLEDPNDQKGKRKVKTGAPMTGIEPDVGVEPTTLRWPF